MLCAMKSMKYQARAEDFQIGVALIFLVRGARKKFLSATPKFLSATPIFWLLGVALRIRCGAKEIYVVEVIRLIEVKEIAYLK